MGPAVVQGRLALLEEKVDLVMGLVVAATVATASDDRDRLEAGGGGGGAGTAPPNNSNTSVPTSALTCFSGADTVMSGIVTCHCRRGKSNECDEHSLGSDRTWHRCRRGGRHWRGFRNCTPSTHPCSDACSICSNAGTRLCCH